jgi:hypothetical protein
VLPGFSVALSALLARRRGFQRVSSEPVHGPRRDAPVRAAVESAARRE